VRGGDGREVVTWERNGKKLNEANATYEFKTAKYSESQVTEIAEGLYTCIVKNKTSSVQSSCTVSVKGVPELTLIDKLEKIEIDKFKASVKSGAEWNVRAQVSGYPKPSVSVVKNKREYSDYKFDSVSSVVTINIKKVQSNDAGVYEVIAKNVAGRAAIAAQLVVAGNLTILISCATAHLKYLTFWRVNFI